MDILSPAYQLQTTARGCEFDIKAFLFFSLGPGTLHSCHFITGHFLPTKESF